MIPRVVNALVAPIAVVSLSDLIALLVPIAQVAPVPLHTSHRHPGLSCADLCRACREC